MASYHPELSDTQPPRMWAYAWWVLVGAAFGVALIGILTIGIFVFPAGVVLLAIALARPELRNEAALAVPAGLALPALYLAWINRAGPGWVCTPDGVSCEDKYSPWPFVGVAVVLTAIAVSLVLAGRRSKTSPARRG